MQKHYATLCCRIVFLLLQIILMIFFTCGYTDTIECSTNLQTMINTCEELSFSVQPNKTVLPTTTMEYLGIEIDTVQMQLILYYMYM